MSVPILLLTKQDKKKHNILFSPTSYPHKKSTKYINFGSLAEFHDKS